MRHQQKTGSFKVLFCEREYDVVGRVLLGFLFYKPYPKKPTTFLGMKAIRLLEPRRREQEISLVEFQDSLLEALYNYVKFAELGSVILDLSPLDVQFFVQHQKGEWEKNFHYLDEITVTDDGWLKIWDAQVEKEKVNATPLPATDDLIASDEMEQWLQLKLSLPIFNQDTHPMCLSLGKLFQRCFKYMLNIPLLPK